MVIPRDDRCLQAIEHSWIGYTMQGIRYRLCLKCNTSELLGVDVPITRKQTKQERRKEVEKLIKRRKRKGISRPNLSRMVGFSVTEFERGHIDPAADLINKIKKALRGKKC